jgi:hypothetical protein
MIKKIRTHLMTDEDERPLRGDVEVDETSWGGKPRRKQGEARYTTPPQERRAASVAFREAKPTVLGMVERGGRVRARVIASRHGAPLRTYPGWAAARVARWAFLKAIRPLASWSSARWFSSFLDQRMSIARFRFSQE